MKLKFLGLVGILAFFGSCKDNDVPEIPKDEETITKVRLIFSSGDEAPKVFDATDPDGEGPDPVEVTGSITLTENHIYDLFIELENEISGESITEEVEAEGDEHQFFFGFTNGLFEYPLGDGNIDEPEAGTVSYQDEDENGLPVGLITRWNTGSAKSGVFRIILKHQPEIKSGETSATDGESDVDLEWPVLIE